jgi:hypothetical protein
MSERKPPTNRDEAVKDIELAAIYLDDGAYDTAKLILSNVLQWLNRAQPHWAGEWQAIQVALAKAEGRTP